LLGIKNDKIFSLSFSVSLHSHKKNISEKLTGSKNTFSKTITGIKNLIKGGAQDVSIYHIITKYNYKDLPSFVNFIHKISPQIKNITFSFIYPAGAALKNIKIFPQLSKVEPYFQRAAYLFKKYGINFSLSTCGTIPLCFLRGYEDVLLKQQDLDQPENVGLVDAKKDVKYQLATKEFHQKTKIKSAECSRCFYNKKCGGIWRFYVELYGIGELKPILKDGEHYPSKGNVLLILTGFSCNNNCVFCSNVADRDINRSTEEIFRDIDKGRKNDYRILEFIGGEVTIRPDFFELISYAKKTGFDDIRLTSNGRLFSYPEFARKAVGTGLKVINISLYGHNKILHDAVTRAPGSFEQCVNGIKNLSGIKDIFLVINTVVSKINYKFLYEIGCFVKKLGVREWHILELLPDGRGAEHYNALAVNYGTLSPYIQKIGELAGREIPRIDIFDFPFCVFDREFLNNKRVVFFTPERRYEDIKQEGYEPERVEKINLGGKIIYSDKYKIKPAFCRRCVHFYRCGGVAKPYFERYKDKEIKELAKKHHFIK